MIDILVIGAGPAGVLAALRAADLGARTVLVTRSEFDGRPVPVRTLAHAARLIREARQGQRHLEAAYSLSRSACAAMLRQFSAASRSSRFASASLA
jgi:pyruvate/2-oxoglutarate dehydrogenase complex dihydrolipoamide dehydrogenase (E3) component